MLHGARERLALLLEHLELVTEEELLVAELRGEREGEEEKYLLEMAAL